MTIEVKTTILVKDCKQADEYRHDCVTVMGLEPAIEY